jgi:hypothetical protein
MYYPEVMLFMTFVHSHTQSLSRNSSVDTIRVVQYASYKNCDMLLACDIPAAVVFGNTTNAILEDVNQTLKCSDWSSVFGRQ